MWNSGRRCLTDHPTPKLGVTESEYAQKLDKVERAEDIPEFNFPDSLSISQLWLGSDVFSSP